jgi:hypothetical protein
MQFEWTVFFGDAADAEARVYVLATPIGETDAANLDGLKITGRVEGPKCRYSHTLPARIPVRFRGVRTSDGRGELVGEAIVPDPNFWTSELPFLYCATVEVRLGEEVVATYEQDFGIRPLGVRGKRLVFDGKTWVPRAVRREVVVGDAPLELWREMATAMVVDDPDEELCREASECGVILFVSSSQVTGARNRIRSICRYPAVAMLIVPHFTLAGIEHHVPDLRSCARNLLIADSDTLEEGVRFGLQSANAAVLHRQRAGGEQIASLMAYDPRPILIQANTGKRSLIEAREACDKLQADLAGKCDPAGYIV